MQKIKVNNAFILIRKSCHGFTLIEMLVVISLIGILAAMAMVSFSSVQKQARDSTRKSDLKQYQTAIESYASKNNGNYTASAVIVIPASGGFCTTLAIGNCPLDPKSPTLQYRYVGSVTNYSVWATLENISAPTTYWIGCANGKVDESTTQPTAGNICPLP